MDGVTVNNDASNYVGNPSNNGPHGMETVAIAGDSWNLTGLKDWLNNTPGFVARDEIKDTNPQTTSTVFFPPMYPLHISTLSYLLTWKNGDEYDEMKDKIRRGTIQYWGLFRNTNTEVGYKRQKTSQSAQISVAVGGMFEIPNLWGKKLKPGTKLWLSIHPDSSVKTSQEYYLGVQKKVGIPEFVVTPHTSDYTLTEDNKVPDWPYHNLYYMGKVMRHCDASYDGNRDTWREISRDKCKIDSLEKVLVQYCPEDRIMGTLNYLKQAFRNTVAANKQKDPATIQSKISFTLEDLQDDARVEAFVTDVIAKRTADSDMGLIPHVTSYLKEKIRPGGQKALDENRYLLEQADLSAAFNASLEVVGLDRALSKYQSSEPKNEHMNTLKTKKIEHLTKMKGFIQQDDWPGFKPVHKAHIEDLHRFTKEHGLGLFAKMFSDEYNQTALEAMSGEPAQNFLHITNLERQMATHYSKNHNK